MASNLRLEKTSAQGVRDYPISNLKSQNEDLGDVYDSLPSKQTTDITQNKEDLKSKTILSKKRKGVHKNNSLDTGLDDKHDIKER